MSHLTSQWFYHCREASDKGRGNLYDLGIHVVREDHQKFFKANKHQADAYKIGFEPNPYYHQYDLLMHLWLNYRSILKREVTHLRKLKRDGAADQIIMTNSLYGITRTDLFFAAAELRWPTTIRDGAHYGRFVREPWSERRVTAFSDERLKNIIGFGGSAQGKTTVFLGMLLMVWDYYLFTQKGARCMISTVNEDKLGAVTWPYLTSLNRDSMPGISLTCGKGQAKGDNTLKRPGMRDDGGVFKGMLLGRQIKESTIVDKLTGSHGHDFIGYILDEAQSTPGAPLVAASNFVQTSWDNRVILAGNYDEDDDTLGRNCVPINGWDSIDEHTGQWESEMENGNRAIVLHFNNEDSPGMDPKLAKQFPHLPNEAKLRRNTPKEDQRTLNNITYRRFWVGFRIANASNDAIMTDEMTKASGGDLDLSISRMIRHVFSFDSAPAEIDRNMVMIGRFGYDAIHTDEKVFGPIALKALDKAPDSNEYYKNSTGQLMELIRKYQIISGGGILDFTGRPAHAEALAAKGFQVHRMIYNQGVPDGVRKDKHTNKKEMPWYLNVELGHRSDEIPLNMVGAHHVAENMISFSAWLCHRYLIAGRLKGINKKLLDMVGRHQGITKEFFFRRFKYVSSNTWGRRIRLIEKEEFRRTYGFSPDIQDTLFQLCLFAYLHEKVPLTPIGGGAMIPEGELFEPEPDPDEELSAFSPLELATGADLWGMDSFNL